MFASRDAAAARRVVVFPGSHKGGVPKLPPNDLSRGTELDITDMSRLDWRSDPPARDARWGFTCTYRDGKKSSTLQLSAKTDDEMQAWWEVLQQPQ